MKTSYENSSNHYDLIMKYVYKKKPEDFFEFFKFFTNKYCQIDIINILDVGCGTGIDIIYFAENGNFNMTGLDVSESMLKKAKEKVSNLKQDIKFINKEIIQLDSNNNYDCIFSYGAFGHILENNEIEQSLLKLHSILKRKGILILHQENIVGIAKYVSDREINFKSSGYDYNVNLRYKVDLIKCLLIEEEQIKVFRGGKIIDEYSEYHIFRNWTYNEGIQFLKKTGFDKIYCFSSIKDREELTGKEVGLIFCCIK